MAADFCAEILTIGDELCRGEIVDTNSAWLADELWALGIPVAWMTSCRDDAADMRAALDAATARADLILVSGGLGPTEDDLTVDVLSEALGVVPETHAPSLEKMQARFARSGYQTTPNNLRQVRVPGGAEPFLNPAGQAPGFGLSLPGRGARAGRQVPLFSFPGVPRELKALWEGFVRDKVRTLAAGAPRVARRLYRVFGLGESHVDHRLAGLVAGVAGSSLHYQVAFPETLVKLVVRDADGAAAAARLAPLHQELLARLGEHVYSFDDGGAGAPGAYAGDSLAAALGRALAARGATLAVAESCTGGMVGSLVTDVAGSSAWFRGGFLVYANELKEALLGVRRETLVAHGAVSAECVAEMAIGARERAGATFGVAVSGVAGPGGGTPEKPVGTVFLAVAGPRGVVAEKKLDYPGARDQVRRLAAYWAMRLVLGAAV